MRLRQTWPKLEGVTERVNPPGEAPMRNSLTEYYRCPESLVRLGPEASPSEQTGYFEFGPGTVCYGKHAESRPVPGPKEMLHNALSDVRVEGGTVFLPFDLEQVVENLRCEVYAQSMRSSAKKRAIAWAYYRMRPLLSVSVRRHLQAWHLRGWDRLTFPHWPVDTTVDRLFGKTMLLCLEAQKLDEIPFIWFWPEGASSCAILTHDVETDLGVQNCPYLMDAADAFDMKSSFQLIPEQRYEVTPALLNSIRQRGFEIAVHDLNHDGELYRDKEEFFRRAAKINFYREQFGASGFRAGVLYRRQAWFDAFDFSYDMSVPNVAHLDPQRGGCCTVMPYFIGKILELPVTATQDYTLFNIFHDYSIDLWKKQIDLIMEKHGLISFIVHPDYVVADRERKIYESLLAYLAKFRSDKGLWITTPGEVDNWWRKRAEMKLVKRESGWQIEGPGSERARVAYACPRDGHISYKFTSASNELSTPTHEASYQ